MAKRTRWKPGWVVVHLWNNAPSSLYFWDGEVAERYIDEAALWADLETGDPLAECKRVDIPDHMFDSVYTGFPPHRLHFYKCAIYVENESTGLLEMKSEPASDALLYFDSLHYNEEDYPGLYCRSDIYLEVVPHRTIRGQKRVRLLVEGPSFTKVEDFFDTESEAIMEMRLEDFSTESKSSE